MMNKIITYYALAASIAIIILLLDKGCNKCPVCPPVQLSETIIHDTITIHDTVAIAKIHLTKVVPQSNTSYDNVHTTSVQQCDSINLLFNSEYSYSIPVEDSIMTGTIDQTISQNKITEFKTSFTYHLNTRIDSVIQTVIVPAYRSCFTIGAFMSKYSSGMAIGYRANRVQGAIGWDLTNKAPELFLTYDLR